MAKCTTLLTVHIDSLCQSVFSPKHLCVGLWHCDRHKAPTQSFYKYNDLADRCIIVFGGVFIAKASIDIDISHVCVEWRRFAVLGWDLPKPHFPNHIHLPFRKYLYVGKSCGESQWLRDSGIEGLELWDLDLDIFLVFWYIQKWKLEVGTKYRWIFAIRTFKQTVKHSWFALFRTCQRIGVSFVG